MIALFIVGPPGVGKTTMVRELFKVLDPQGLAYLCPKPKWTVAEGAFAAAGHYTGATFDGADTVPYTGAMQALDHLEQQLSAWRPQWVIFDGDRFSYTGAIERVRKLMPAKVVHFNAEDILLTERRLKRGSNQNPVWLKGRATKARRFADAQHAEDRIEVNADCDPLVLAATVLTRAAEPKS